MTSQQIGRYRHGMYGYPVRVVCEPPEGEDPVDLTGATVITLELQRINPRTGSVVSRDLNLSVITDPGGGLTSPVITWTVLDGDIPEAGIYRMTLTIDFGPSQRLIFDGNITVS